MYARNDGKTWIPTMLITGGLFPLACFSIAAVLNTIAIGYHSLAAVPFGTIVLLLLIWMLVSFPLCLLGTVRALLVHAGSAAARLCCAQSQVLCAHAHSWQRPHRVAALG